jgi:hypothetical protein
MSWFSKGIQGHESNCPLLRLKFGDNVLDMREHHGSGLIIPPRLVGH